MNPHNADVYRTQFMSSAVTYPMGVLTHVWKIVKSAIKLPYQNCYSTVVRFFSLSTKFNSSVADWKHCVWQVWIVQLWAFSFVGGIFSTPLLTKVPEWEKWTFQIKRLFSIAALAIQFNCQNYMVNFYYTLHGSNYILWHGDNFFKKNLHFEDILASIGSKIIYKNPLR